MILVSFPTCLVTVNSYVLVVVLSSAVTTISYLLSPTLNDLLPNPSTFDVDAFALPVIVILSVVYGTVNVYTKVSLLNAGLIVYPVTPNDFKLASEFGNLVTSTLYVFFVPLCAVTITVTSFVPTFNVLEPVPDTLATLLVASADTVVDVTLFATVHVYEVVSLSNPGDNVHPVKLKLVNVSVVSCALVTVIVYVFSVPFPAVTTTFTVFVPTSNPVFPVTL